MVNCRRHILAMWLWTREQAVATMNLDVPVAAPGGHDGGVRVGGDVDQSRVLSGRARGHRQQRVPEPGPTHMLGPHLFLTMPGMPVAGFDPGQRFPAPFQFRHWRLTMRDNTAEAPGATDDGFK